MENLPLNCHKKDYYNELGVAKCSTPRQIKAAYRKAAKKVRVLLLRARCIATRAATAVFSRA